MNNTNKASNTKLHKHKADHKQKRHKQSPGLGKTAKSKTQTETKKTQTDPWPGENCRSEPKNKTQKTQADPQPGEIPDKIKTIITGNPRKPRIQNIYIYTHKNNDYVNNMNQITIT